MRPDAWSRQARQLCRTLEAPTLEAFLRLGGAEATSPDETWDEALAAVLEVLLDAAARRQGLPAYPHPNRRRRDLGPVTQTLDALVARAPRPWHDDLIGVAFENLHSRRPRREAGGWSLGTASRRKRRGVFFTPPAMVRFLTHQTLHPLVTASRTPDDLLRLRLVDPALGAGFFLLDALRYLADAAVALAGGPGHLDPTEARRRVATGCLHGFDVDPRATEIARALLWLAVGDPGLDPDALAPNLRVGDALLDPDLAGLTGFDAVLSNPPWSKVHSARALAASGRYPAQRMGVNGRTTRGDPDLYKYFAERSFHLTAPRGRLGLVIPSAFGTTQGAAGLRQLYFQHGRFELWAGFENRHRYFPIHSMFRYALLVYQKGRTVGQPSGIERLHAGLCRVEELSDSKAPPPRLDLAWLRKTAGPSLAIPEVRTRAEADLFARLHDRFPPLGETTGAPWSVRFVRELDMTNDRGLFVEGSRRTGDPGRYRPLYEGRLVHQFNCAAKAYRGGTGRRARWDPQPADAPPTVQPHWWVETRAARRAIGDTAFDLPRAGFCDVTGHANERTVLAALIPAEAPCGNKVPTLRFERSNPIAPPDPRLPLLWLAIANSFVVDWLLRRRVSTTLNLFYWRQLPFPRPDPADPDDLTAQTLWTTAARLSQTGDSAIQRAALRAELDAMVATLYGLSDDDLRLILADFPLLDRGQPTPITADLARWALLRHQGQHHTPTARRLARRIAQAEAAGAVAYIPSELALHENRQHGSSEPINPEGRRGRP